MRRKDTLKSQVRYRGWELKHTGHDYSEDLLERSVSPYLYANMKGNALLGYLNDLLVLGVDAVKHIRVFNNVAVPEDYKKIN